MQIRKGKNRFPPRLTLPEKFGKRIETMTIEEKVREIMLSEELPESEKLDRLHALIPLEVFKIDSLSTATPAQIKQLKDGLMVTDAMQQVRRARNVRAF